MTGVQGAAPTNGVTNVTGTFGATGSSSSFRPMANRAFNIHISGTFVATVVLERLLNGDWVQKWPDSAYQFTAPRSMTDGESEHGIDYRLRCTGYTSGTVKYSLSQ